MLSRSLFSLNILFWPSVVMHTYNSSSREAETGVLQAEGQPVAQMQRGLLQVSLDCHVDCDLCCPLPQK